MIKRLIVSCFFLLLFSVSNVNSAQDSVKNVIIVVIDGVRYTEGLGAESNYLKFIWNDLRPIGAINTNFYTDGQTQTNSGHGSLITGTWQNLNNDGSQRPSMPTLFEYMRKERGSPKDSCYSITTKPKLDICTHSSHPDFGSAYGAYAVVNADYPDSLDIQTWNNVKQIMTDTKPRYILLISRKLT